MINKNNTYFINSKILVSVNIFSRTYSKGVVITKFGIGITLCINRWFYLFTIKCKASTYGALKHKKNVALVNVQQWLTLKKNNTQLCWTVICDVNIYFDRYFNRLRYNGNLLNYAIERSPRWYIRKWKKWIKISMMLEIPN